MCSWLGLAVGTWPPDHYALLGLARGVGDFAEIETRVLDRMELLRPHQLLHPETVTAGMNRLAQALVCLTNPVTRAAYDRELGITSTAFEVVTAEPPLAEEFDDSLPTEVPFDVIPNLPYEVVEDPKPLPYELVPYEVVPDSELAEELPLAYEVVPENELTSRPPSQPPTVPLSLRMAYRRLAALRRAIRAWESLRPVFGNPTAALATPVAVLAFLQTVAEARNSLEAVSFVLRANETPGGVVAGFVRHPQALPAFRLLLPSQRESLALDWRRGYAALLYERKRLRELATSARVQRKQRPLAVVRRTLRRSPAWWLALIPVLVIMLVLIRRVTVKL